MKTMISTPRGTFRLVTKNEAREKILNGFGYHHEHDGYVVIGDGTTAYAVIKDEYEKYHQEKQMIEIGGIVLDNVVAVGKCKNGFYLVQNHGDYYSVYTNDVVPENFDAMTLEKYMDKHETDGCSVSGSKKDVMDSLAEYMNMI